MITNQIVQRKNTKNHNGKVIKCDFEILPNVKIYIYKYYRMFFICQKTKSNKHLIFPSKKKKKKKYLWSVWIPLIAENTVTK